VVRASITLPRHITGRCDSGRQRRVFFFSEKRIILIYSRVHHRVTNILEYKKITTKYIQTLLFIIMVLAYHIFPHLNSKLVRSNTVYHVPRKKHTPCIMFILKLSPKAQFHPSTFTKSSASSSNYHQKHKCIKKQS
jgi:hypothetical protein